MSADVQEYTLELVRTRYGISDRRWRLKSIVKHDIQGGGRETLRTWMSGEGLWQSRKQCRSFHQSRLRWESYGELIQIDGGDHRWFEQRGEASGVERLKQKGLRRPGRR